MRSVSIAMATYNGDQFISQQLDSLMAQSYLPAELIVTDDGSTDRTLEIVEEFRGRAPFPVQVFKNKQRLGYKGNFMEAASHCSGDIVAFCDQDDIWEPRKLNECMKCFDDTDILLCHHNAVFFDGTTGRKLGVLHESAQDSIIDRMNSLPWSYSHGLTQLFRRSLLDLSNDWENSIDHRHAGRLAHDQWFFFLASALGKIKYLADPLVLYRQHDRNIFGFKGKTPFVKSVRELLSWVLWMNEDRYHVLSAAARNRATILENVSLKADEALRSRAIESALRYKGIAELYRLRREVHTSKSLFERLRALREIARLGGYNSSGWGLGRKAVIKDICLGLTFAGLLLTCRSHGTIQPEETHG
jgi:glycosyltransferase involved in cell wall biosynthesis